MASNQASTYCSAWTLSFDHLTKHFAIRISTRISRFSYLVAFICNIEGYPTARLKMNLLALPYDIRHKIYEHSFPPGQQIYIQVLGSELKSITPEYKIPNGLLLTCRALNAEANEYLYNSYLFNIIGTKQDCLSAYKSFLANVKKHARDEVHVDAFSNGAHSSTMCISIHSGAGRVAMLERRERGERKEIAELEYEVASSAASRRSPRSWTNSTYAITLLTLPLRDIILTMALVVLLFAWFIGQ